jgi:predicted chitinase
MYNKPVQKKRSSWTAASIQNKSKSLSKPGTFSVQPKSESKSSQQQQIPDYSTRAADALATNVMRSLETPQHEQEQAHSVQRQIEPGAAFVIDGVTPIAQSPTFSIQSKEVGIQRQCSECAKEQQQESAEEGKDVDERSLWASAIQTKLTIGAAGDKYEQEADRVAAQVMSMSVAPDSSPQVQRFGEESNPVQKWSLAQSITPVAQRQVDEQVQLREIVQRAFQSGGTQASGDLESRLNASKGGGSALAPEVRAFMEPRFGADFSSVRVHTGAEAVQMNRELGAQAFTHGSDVYFGARKSPGNNELTAHELTHVVQQTGAVQRQENFHESYHSRDGKVKSSLGKDYETYLGELGSTERSSKYGGTPITEPITTDELLEIFDGVQQDIDNQKVEPSVIDEYVNQLNHAFRTLKIDTIQAQASYIANAYIESDQFRAMTETQKAVKGNSLYQDDPHKVKLAEKWLNDAAAGKIPNVAGYKKGGSINPTGNWQESFIGRGPIQVTHRHYYVQCIAILENRARELEAEAKKEYGATGAYDEEATNEEDALRLYEAAAAIKADPAQAANPKYAFLISAAFMKMKDGNGRAGDAKASKGQVTSWMGPQHKDMKVKKDSAYGKAIKVLKRKVSSEEPN